MRKLNVTGLKEVGHVVRGIEITANGEHQGRIAGDNAAEVVFCVPNEDGTIPGIGKVVTVTFEWDGEHN